MAARRMIEAMRAMLLVLVLLSLCAAQQTAPLERLSRADKLIVVVTPDWNAVSGTLRRYERKKSRWKQAGNAVAIVVGKTGLAWDPTLGAQSGGGPVKHEGDGKSPAGVFAIPNTFGFAPSLGGTPMYMPLTPTTECVDDASSRYYTQIIDRLKISDVDWNSSEKMRQVPGYKEGALVDYNMSNPVPGNGSCIFLHVWSGPGQGTVGCTAMAEDDMVKLAAWIESKGATVLVQLPRSEYQRLKAAWDLP